MKEGWPVKKLGEVCEIIMGQSPDGDSYNTTGEGVPLINGPVEFSTESFGKTVRSKFTTQPTKFCEEGDLILCVRGSTTGRMNIAGFDACIGRGVAAIRAKQYQPWINHFINSKREEIHGKGTGATFPNVSGDSLANFELVVPPLAEQHRIVGLLDEAFEGLATAKANAEKNLQNARALFESHLQSVFSQRGPGWVETTLSQATGGVFTGPFGSLLHKSDYVANGIPLVNPAHITEIGIEPDLRKTVSHATAQRLKNYIMRAGDIVIGRRGEMGRCALVTKVEDGWLCGTGSFFIRPSSRCDTSYLVRFLRSDGCKAKLEKIAGGAVMPNLSNTDLGNLTIDLPPLDRQKAIVEEIDDLHQETQRLTALYEQKLAALEALKKSLLHQAFSGNL
jgi:type I restriction enzyme, S subunit